MSVIIIMKSALLIDCTHATTLCIAMASLFVGSMFVKNFGEALTECDLRSPLRMKWRCEIRLRSCPLLCRCSRPLKFALKTPLGCYLQQFVCKGPQCDPSSGGDICYLIQNIKVL